MMKKRAVFLDRDGTINRDVGYPNSYDMVEIFPYSFASVRKINEAGFLSVIVTNQSGIGKGLIEEKNLSSWHVIDPCPGTILIIFVINKDVHFSAGSQIFVICHI